MTSDELLKTNKGWWTKEECKLLDEGVKVTFFDSIEEYDQEKQDYEKWIKDYNSDLELKAELLTINERVVVIYH
jgi:hypothetical protein